MKFFKRTAKKPEQKGETTFIIAMVLLPDTNSFSYSDFINDIKTSLVISDESGDNAIAVFQVDGEQVYLSIMDVPVPADDIEGTAKYAYNWMITIDDLKVHRAHIIVALSSQNKNFIGRYKILTAVVSSLLRTTDAIGVYDGGQSLLIKKSDYLVEATACAFSDDTLPLDLWIYFGLRTSNYKTNGYTYGLKTFGYDEIEIIGSLRSLKEIREFLFNAAHYVLLNNVTLQDGQTIGFDTNEKIKISNSKSRFVGGNSFKLAY